MRAWLYTLAPFLVGQVTVAVRYGSLTIGSAATWMGCWLVRLLWLATLSKIFLWLASISIVRQHPFGRLRAWDAAIKNWLNAGLAWSERAMVYGLNQLVDSFAVLIGVPVAIALVVADLAKIVGAKILTTVTHLDVGKLTRPIYKAVAAVRAEGIRWRRAWAARLRAVEARAIGAARVAGRAIALPFPRIGALERKVAAQAGRLSRLEKLALGATATAVLVKTLSRLGLGFLRCSNVKRAGRAVCGMDTDLLSALLLDIAVLGFAFNLRTFTRELQWVTGEAAGLIEDFATAASEAELLAEKTAGVLVPR